MDVKSLIEKKEKLIEQKENARSVFERCIGAIDMIDTIIKDKKEGEKK